MIKYFIILIGLFLISCSSIQPISNVSGNCVDKAKDFKQRYPKSEIIVVAYDKYDSLHAINHLGNYLYDCSFNIKVSCKKEDIIKTVPLYWGSYQHNWKDRL